MEKKHYHRWVYGIVIVAVVFTFLFTYFPNIMSIQAQGRTALYMEELFDSSVISQIEIEVAEEVWQEMLDNALEEEYISCTLTINGETYREVGIRPKGNSSLTMVSRSDSDRYSFKIKMDEYVSGQSYYGLTKFVVNNCQGDSTYMKEILSYDLMEYMGVVTPCRGYARISVNGEPVGLYLAVETLEEEFLARNFGTDYGNLYKPETMNMNDGMAGKMDGRGDRDANGMAGIDENVDGQIERKMPEEMFGTNGIPEGQPPENPQANERQMMGGPMQGGSAQGADLVYQDDQISSYANVFENTVMKSTNSEDMERVIQALKGLNTFQSATEIRQVVDIEEVLRYFAVNTTLVNLDSYISGLLHNYYLYEEEGVISILPWDLNLSFGGFQSGNSQSVVNFPIDEPVAEGVDLSERPLIGRLLEFEELQTLYHEYLQEIVDGYFKSGIFESSIEKYYQLIKNDVENDPTAFFTYQQFEEGVKNLEILGSLRAESIQGQLMGDIPSTYDEQKANLEKLLDASRLNMEALGSQGANGSLDRGSGWMRGPERRENGDVRFSEEIQLP